eukprot:3937795-Amphidinium_carterae.1
MARLHDNYSLTDLQTLLREIPQELCSHFHVEAYKTKIETMKQAPKRAKVTEVLESVFAATQVVLSFYSSQMPADDNGSGMAGAEKEVPTTHERES